MAMPMPAAMQWTLDEMHAIPEDGNRYELVRGALLMTPAPSYGHQSIVGVLGRILSRYVETERLGLVEYARSVIRIDGSETEPDLMVRPAAARRPLDWESAPLPILVVEIMSDSSRRRDRVIKRMHYREIGVPEYWIVDAADREITVVRPGADDVSVTGLLEWRPVGGRRSLEIDVAALFGEARG